MLKLLFCLRTFTEFYSHIHAFILTKQTVINTDCGEDMHFSALVSTLGVDIKYLSGLNTHKRITDSQSQTRPYCKIVNSEVHSTCIHTFI